MTEEKKEETQVEVTETEDKEFNDAFSDATSDKPQKSAEVKKEEAKPVETKDEPLLQEKAPDLQLTPAKTREQELEEELLKARQKMSSWEGRISAANEEAKKAKEELERVRLEKEKKQDDLPNEDDKVVKEFIDEFPDLHRPIVAMVKKELLPIIGQMIDSRMKTIEPQVTTIKQKLEDSTTEAHFSAILMAHPDWEQIRDSGELNKWIDSQKSYIKDALIKVRDRGNAEEVIEMFNQYKLSKGQLKEQSLSPEGRNPKSKAQDLLAVPASPTTPSTDNKGKDKNDYDSAWEEASKEG